MRDDSGARLRAAASELSRPLRTDRKCSVILRSVSWRLRTRNNKPSWPHELLIQMLAGGKHHFAQTVPGWRPDPALQLAHLMYSSAYHFRISVFYCARDSCCDPPC